MINGQITLFDVSFWQDDDYTPYKIDFNKMRSRGGDGVILRAGQNVWEDEDYRDYVLAARSAGIPDGAYWFFDSRTSPIPQADIFCDLIEEMGFPDLGLWADYEEKYGGSWGGGINFKIFVDRVKERFPGRLVGIYTGYYYWLEHTLPQVRYAFAHLPLWISRYKATEPMIPDPWTNWVIWQYTDSGDGHYFGAESNEIDMNVFYGSLETYRLFFNIPDYVPAEPLPEEGEIGMFRVVNDYSTMSLRETNSINGNRIGTVAQNTTMTADRIEAPVSGGFAGDKWAHIPSVMCTDGVTREGWLAIIHNGFTYCQYEEITETEPGTLPTIKVTLEAEGYPTLEIDWMPDA